MRIDETIHCDGCGVEVLGALFLANNQEFCCQTCSEGLACDCADRMEQEDDVRSQNAGSVALPGY